MAVSFETITFTWEALGGALLIAFARMVDVALGVLRLNNTANGRRKAAWTIGFFEALIWVIAVAGVIGSSLSNINLFNAIAYSLGFATGTFVGITIEGILARGEQVVRVFTHEGDKLADSLRQRGFRVTQIDARGRDGPIQLLFIQVARRKAAEIPELARELDRECFIVIDDVRSTSSASRSGTFTAVNPGK